MITIIALPINCCDGQNMSLVHSYYDYNISKEQWQLLMHILI